MPSTVETRKTYRAVLSEAKLVIPHDDLPVHGVTEETSLSAESSSNLAIAVPQKRTVLELNDPPTQEVGSSQKKKRKKNFKGMSASGAVQGK